MEIAKRPKEKKREKQDHTKEFSWWNRCLWQSESMHEHEQGDIFFVFVASLCVPFLFFSLSPFLSLSLSLSLNLSLNLSLSFPLLSIHLSISSPATSPTLHESVQKRNESSSLCLRAHYLSPASFPCWAKMNRPHASVTSTNTLVFLLLWIWFLSSPLSLFFSDPLFSQLINWCPCLPPLRLDRSICTIRLCGPIWSHDRRLLPEASRSRWSPMYARDPRHSRDRTIYSNAGPVHEKRPRLHPCLLHHCPSNLWRTGRTTTTDP